MTNEDRLQEQWVISLVFWTNLFFTITEKQRTTPQLLLLANQRKEKWQLRKYIFFSSFNWWFGGTEPLRLSHLVSHHIGCYILDMSAKVLEGYSAASPHNSVLNWSASDNERSGDSNVEWDWAIVSTLVGKQTVTNSFSTLQVICDVLKLDSTLSMKTCVSFRGDVCLSWNRETLILSVPSQYRCHMFDTSCFPGNPPLRGEQRVDLSVIRVMWDTAGSGGRCIWDTVASRGLSGFFLVDTTEEGEGGLDGFMVEKLNRQSDFGWFGLWIWS